MDDIKTLRATKAETCYSENCQQFRALNTQMNQIPALAMTLTGGLWFGAGIKENLDTEIRFALLIFAGLSNVALILIVIRIRDVLQSYLDKIKAFDPSNFVDGRPEKPRVAWLGNYSMVTIFCMLMLQAAVLSFFGAFWKYWPFEFSRWCGVAAFGNLLVLNYLIFMRTCRKAGEAGA